MHNILLEILYLLALDIAFIGICLAVLIPLSMYKRAALAVLKRLRIPTSSARGR